MISHFTKILIARIKAEPLMAHLNKKEPIEEIRNISTKNGQISSEWERRESPEKIASTEKEQVFESIKFIKKVLQSYEQ